MIVGRLVSGAQSMTMGAEDDQGVPVECYKHYLGRRPQVTWGAEMGERNLTFLRGLDPHYFVHIAETQAPLLETESRQYAAATIRVAYEELSNPVVGLIRRRSVGCPIGRVVRPVCRW